MISPITLNSKLPLVGTTIFTKMSALAKEHNALNLSQGFPDFDCDKKLVELVTKAMQNANNQYAPMGGVLALREAIAEKTAHLYGAEYDAESEVTITAGATQAIFTTISALIREGDEVIVFTPAYDCYEPAIELAGGKAVHIRLTQPDFKIDWNELKRLVNRKTRMIIINSPHNPTGATLDETDMAQLEKLTDNSDILILSDEVYEHIIFDGAEHHSVAKYPKLAERAVIISSFGKTYHTTGWKLGYCLAPNAIMNEIRKVHQFNVFSVNTPMQFAYAEMLKDRSLYEGLGAFYQEKRDFFANAIAPSKFKLITAAGTYFQLLDYADISNEKDIDFATRLTSDYKIASIPISVFYHNEIESTVLRFCFAKSNETLSKAADILNKIK